MSVIYPIAWRAGSPVPLDGGLTQEQAQAIHTLYHDEKLGPAEIAARHDVPLTTVQAVLRGAIWPIIARHWQRVAPL